MNSKKVVKKRGRGKPRGTRQKDGLYTQILELLQQNKNQKGDGYTAFAVAKYIGETHQTVQQYLADLVIMKRVKQRKISNLLLFSIK
jgi:response regulator of citrate/malate metabolism